MTNVSGTPKKLATRLGLFAFAERTLEREGWEVSRIPRGGKASLRLITRGAESYKVSIRTSQDTWIAFPRRTRSEGWVTLDEVDFVVAASVNDRHNPREARVHMIPGDDARARFNRAYAARERAGHTLPVGRGIWLSLYDVEADDPVSHVGAGMGIVYPPLAVADLTKQGLIEAGDTDDDPSEREDNDTSTAVGAERPLTLADAKRRLSESLGVPESAIKITVEY